MIRSISFSEVVGDSTELCADASGAFCGALGVEVACFLGKLPLPFNNQYKSTSPVFYDY